MSTADKQRKHPSFNHQSCRYISRHTTIEEQAQCLRVKESQLASNGGKKILPCRVQVGTNNVKLRQKADNKAGVGNRMSAVTSTKTGNTTVVIHRQTKRPVSTGNIDSYVCTSQPAHQLGNNKRHSVHLSTSKNYKQLTANNESCANTTDVVHLLHPDWRKIPWKLYFGWTDAHWELCRQLKCEVMRGKLECIYYKSAKEYCVAGMAWRYHHSDSQFLGGPLVSTVSEVLEMIHRVHSRKAVNRQLTDSVSHGYEGDDEE